MSDDAGRAVIWLITFVGFTATVVPHVDLDSPWIGHVCAVVLILAGLLWVSRMDSRRRRRRFGRPRHTIRSGGGDAS